jgi:acyl-CoA thioester hydrolase
MIETYRGAIYPWHCDHMGHMNVMWYVGKYKRELHAGDTVIVRSAFLEVREKLARFVHEMRNAVTDEVSAICVLTGVHIDAQARKSCPFPAEIVERGRSLVRTYDLPT